LALTGLTPETLRQELENPEVLSAVLDFLCAHEPDLLAAAEALGLPPVALVSARDRLAA
jgi:adenine/guanine phosphoribosyltransferase-like PRPP-binding protein